VIIASHVIFSAYGFWLPNDPRGSWSDFVRNWELTRFGPATKVSTTRSLARNSHDRQSRRAAKRALAHPPTVFTGIQARAIARAFDEFIERNSITVWACAILPEHVHMVIARHHYDVEQIVNLLKGAATRRLKQDGLSPAGDGWARRLWKVFLDAADDVVRAVRYVRGNPAKEGKREQPWSFVAPCPYV